MLASSVGLRGWAAALAGAVLSLVAAAPASAFPIAPSLRPVSLGADPGYSTIAETWNGTAACLDARETSLGMQLAPHLDAGGVDAQVAGFDLKDQSPEAVTAFRALTRQLERDIARGRAAPVASPCQDVVCAMSALVGPDLGPRMLLLALRYGYMTSDLGARADRRWTAAELDVVLAAAADLPRDWFAPDGGGYRILLHRNTEAVIRLGAMAPVSGDLVALAGEGYPGVLVADGWDRINMRERRVVVAHELAHELSRKAPKRWRGAWWRAAKADRALGRARGAASAVSVYADTDLGEDFAESVAAYRYMPQLLQARAPNRYAFLRDTVFQGAEYGDQAGCRPSLEPRMTVAGLAPDIADR